MSARISRFLAVGGCAVAAAVTVGAACARESSARTVGIARGDVAIVTDDTASLSRLLNTVRGVDPLLCELATRTVDMHGSWSRWGDLGGNPLEVDSTAAAMIEWIQRDHRNAGVVPRLRAAMQDPDACVRRVAGSFLGRVDHPSALDALLAALEDPKSGTRYVAALGLGLSENPVGITALVKRLRDDAPMVRRASAWALGSLEASAALTPLIETLERDSDPRVRQAAAWAIGRVHE